MKTGQSIELSPQNLIDCVQAESTDGCNGGIMSDAYKYLLRAGIVADKDYPYVSTLALPQSIVQY